MAIELVGYKVDTTPGRTSSWSTSLTDLTGGIDTAPSAGDHVLVAYGIASTNAYTPVVLTAGYDVVATGAGDDTYAGNISLSIKEMSGTPDTSVTLARTANTSAAGTVAVYVYRGVDAANPLDVAAVVSTGTNSFIPNPGAITPITPGSVIFVAGSGGAASSSRTYSSPDLSNFSTAYGSDTYDSNIGAGDYAWVSGAFNPGVWTLGVGDDTASGGWAAVTIALRPSGGAIESGAGTSAGTSTASGVGQAIKAANGTSAGTSAASGAGASTAASAGTSAGTSTASGAGSAVASALGTSSGVSATSGVGAAGVVASGSGTASGTGTATGEAASSAASIGTSVGSSTAVGAASTVAASVGTATGAGEATGAGALSLVASGAGIAAGTSTAAGAGAATAEAAAVSAAAMSAGTSTAAGDASAIAASVGTTAGTAVSVGSGSALVSFLGTAAGIATALGVGVDAATLYRRDASMYQSTNGAAGSLRSAGGTIPSHLRSGTVAANNGGLISGVG